MGTYNIPRDTKGEGRLFYIFSTKALIYTVIGIVIGALFKWILGLLGKAIPAISGICSIIGIVLIVILGVIGFSLGTFKVPHNDRFEITKKAAGIKLDKILFESIKFKLKKDKYYVYDTKEFVREEVFKEEKELKEKEEKMKKLREEEIANNYKNRRGYIKNER